MAKIDTKEMFQLAYDLREEREETLKKMRANREVLRNLDISGMLSEEESAELEELYPVRTRDRDNSGEVE